MARIQTRRIDTTIGKLRFVGTVTVIHDPVAVEAAEAFMARCLAARLPQLVAREQERVMAQAATSKQEEGDHVPRCGSREAVL